MSDVCMIAVFLVGGIVGIDVAITFKRGKRRAGFLPVPSNLQIPRYWHYGSLPIGIECLVVVIGFLTDSRPLALFGLFGGTLIALVFMGMKPRWLEPQWMSWLRDHYSH